MLLYIQFLLQGKHPIPLYFAPNIEEGKGNVETFLPDNPINIMEEGKFNHVPLILGYMAEEGKMLLKGKIMGNRSRPWWSRGNMLTSRSKVCRFKPG